MEQEAPRIWGAELNAKNSWQDLNVVLLIIHRLEGNGIRYMWVSSGRCLGFRKVVSPVGLAAAVFQKDIFVCFHKHPVMLKLHFLLLMDVVKFNLNSVTLPIWQRNHFNYRRSVNRKLSSIYLSLNRKSVSWTAAAGSGFALVRGKLSSPVGNKLIECIWNGRIPPVTWFLFQLSSCCGSFIIVAMLYWKAILLREKFK